MEIVTYIPFFCLLGYWVFKTYNLWRDREQLRQERDQARQERDQAIAAFVEADARIREMAYLFVRAEQIVREALDVAHERGDLLQDALGLAHEAEKMLAEQDRTGQKVTAQRARPGRPALTPEEQAKRAAIVKQVLELAEQKWITQEEACARLKVSYRSFREWLKYTNDE